MATIAATFDLQSTYSHLQRGYQSDIDIDRQVFYLTIYL